MKKIHFPYVALCIGLMLMLFIIEGSVAQSDGQTRVPLLTLLVFNECAFVLCAAGAYVGISHYKQAANRMLYGITIAICCLLTVMFLLQGVKLWPM